MFRSGEGKEQVPPPPPVMANDNYYCSSAAGGLEERPLISPSSAISNLGDDLLMNILIRLPDPKSAFQSKSVCKRWNALLSAPYFLPRFVSHHRILSAGQPPLVIPTDARELISTLLPMPSEEIKSTNSLVLDCFDDLLLVVFKNDRRNFLLCNPFTKQWVALPSAPPMSTWSSKWTARLVCEPRKSVSLDLGDGEEEKSIIHGFRVVRMFQWEHGRVLIDVFCSNLLQWTKLSLDWPHVPSPSVWDRHLRGILVSLNGKLYWKEYDDRVVEWNPFRPEKDVIILPSTSIDRRISFMDLSFVSTSGGALYFVILDQSVFRFLTLCGLEEEEGWKVRYGVSLSKLMLTTNTVTDNYGCRIWCSKLEQWNVVGQHSQEAEVVYLEGFDRYRRCYVILSCNLRLKEWEFFGYRRECERNRVGGFRPRVGIWPIAIPNYEKLQGASELGLTE